MPVERQALVIRLESQRLWLRLQGRCSQCAGCAGRCDLTRALRNPDGEEGEVIIVPVEGEVRLQAGQSVTLRLADSALSTEAWWAYGVPTLGLLLGAGLAAIALGPSHPWLNAAVLLSAALGTLAALVLSKRHSGRAIRAGLRVVAREEQAITAADQGKAR